MLALATRNQKGGIEAVKRLLGWKGQQTVALVRALMVGGLLKALPRGHACPGRRSACAAVRATNKGKACLDPAPEGFISAPEPRSMASKS